MAYIGTQPTVGLVTKLDNIASSFNGILTTFQLALPPGGTGNNFTPGSVYQIIVSLGGVIQNPNTDYILNGSQITFTTAPAAGLTCFIIALGQSINVGTPSAGTVTTPSFGTLTSLPLTGATSGTTTIQAPAVAGNNTLTLPTSNGSAYQVIRNGATAGSLEYVDKIVSGTAQNSTSGTSIDFTGIPSWVKRVTVMFNGVSTNGSGIVQVQLGTGTYTISGYLGAGTSLGSGPTVNSSAVTTGFYAGGGGAAVVAYGHLLLTLLSGNIWVASGCIARSDLASNNVFGGSVSLSGTLDRLRIIGSATGNPADTFDAGSINILYE